MQEDKNIEWLIFRYLQGETSSKEEKIIEEWINMDTANKQVFERLSNDLSLKEDLKDLFNLVDGKHGAARIRRMRKEVMSQTDMVYRRIVWKSWMSYAAACLLLFIGLSVFIWKEQIGVHKELISESSIDNRSIQPGKNRAMLTMEDGTSVELREDEEELVIRDGAVMYGGGDHVVQVQKERKMLLLQTPRGGQFVVVLPDGSKVHLNAESSLKYPNYFDGNKRLIELKGEAFFEVSKSDVPFVVRSDRQEVEVLGTAFNMSTYPSDKLAHTTLVHGKVKVKSHGEQHILNPGQQLEVNGGKITLKSVDTDLYTAWKDGAFSFSDETLESILTRAARWYDVKVVYQSESIQKLRFEGFVSRSSDIRILLQALESTGDVYFKVEGNTVSVFKN